MSDSRTSRPSGPTRRPSGKQRAVRIPLDYYKRRDGQGWLRLVLVVLAPLLALGWWFGGAVLWGDRGDLRASHGPVAAVHATWEADCESCHTPFKPIKSDAAFAGRGSRDLAPSDQNCRACHSGPDHHSNQNPSLVESCGGCHRDHRGREADLNRIADEQCMICHTDLASGRSGEALAEYADISRFHVDHPDFAIRVVSDDGLGQVLGRLGDGDRPTDPSQLKFNHALHLTPGLESGFTFADLDHDDRGRYGWIEGTEPTTPIAMECRSCHVLDGGDLPGGPPDASTWGNHPAKSSGSYYLPISFEKHCRACHPLTVGLPDGDERSIELPHRIQPSAIRRFLQQAFAARSLESDRSLLERSLPSEPTDAERQAIDRTDQAVREALEAMLSDSGTRSPGQRPRSRTVGETLDIAVARAEQTLYSGRQTCGECHVFDRADVTDPSTWTVVQPDIPEVWFPHARFSHVAHRAVNCNDCHDGARESTTSDDILMASVETCRRCHKPAEFSGGRLSSGGARFDCVGCHRYHNGDRPMQGVGALARQVDEGSLRAVEALIRGSTGREHHSPAGAFAE